MDYWRVPLKTGNFLRTEFSLYVLIPVSPKSEIRQGRNGSGTLPHVRTKAQPSTSGDQ